MNDAPECGETWVYESIAGALPGMRVDEAGIIILQVAVFKVAAFVFAWVYDLRTATVMGTAAIVVTAVGNVVMLRMGGWTRAARVPTPYRRLLFGSSIEVVLGVFVFIALMMRLFTFDPRQSGVSLITTLFDPEPPVVIVYLTLLILWDPCYWIGMSWWVAVVDLWGTIRYRFDGPAAETVRWVNLLNVGFAVAQAPLLPFIAGQSMLLLAVGEHVVAVTVVSVTAAALARA